MVPIAPYFGDLAQAGLAAIAVVLMLVSLNAYRRRSEGRYLTLAAAFVCLCAVALVTTIDDLLVGVPPGVIQGTELYLIPSLEFLMAVCFLAALLWSPSAKSRMKVALPVAIVLVALAAVSAYSANSSGIERLALPTGCVRPSGGFLIVASALGYNQSMAHGAPAKSWPVLDIAAGSNVTITVCNTYQETVGFQVAHYLQDKVEAVPPGQVLTLNFVADERGAFSIYCLVFSPIHVFLQGGELKVV